VLNCLCWLGLGTCITPDRRLHPLHQQADPNPTEEGASDDEGHVMVRKRHDWISPHRHRGIRGGGFHRAGRFRRRRPPEHRVDGDPGEAVRVQSVRGVGHHGLPVLHRQQPPSSYTAGRRRERESAEPSDLVQTVGF